jgi:hypothetical protein
MLQESRAEQLANPRPMAITVDMQIREQRVDCGRPFLVLSYELNRQRNNRINGCNCRGIAVMCVQCTMRTDDKVK